MNRLMWLGFLGITVVPSALGIPSFARRYKQTCATCHSAVPKLNTYGEWFAGENFKLPNWKENTVSYGDSRLYLPEVSPIAFRMQGFVQAREASAIDNETGTINADSSVDFQAPYLIKMLSGGPLTERISYYFYAIFAEKGENGEFLVEDAWFSWSEFLGTPVDVQVGQFQVSDLMFPREVRLGFQDYLAYRMAGLTYDRGMIAGMAIGPVDLDVGAVNGNGITENFTVNSPGFQRPDHLFDDNSNKSVFARVGTSFGQTGLGVFGLSGERKRGVLDEGPTYSDVSIFGLDLTWNSGSEWSLFIQYLHNRWDNFLELDRRYEWWGGFVGLDYIPSDRWAFSFLLNWNEAGDLDGTNTVYEGIDARIFTISAARYLARNVRVLAEANVDLLDEDQDAFPFGHTESDHSFLIGVDFAF